MSNNTIIHNSYYYISFFNGRNNIDEEIENWGYQGPLLGPLMVSFTEGKLRFDGYDNEQAELYTTPDGKLCIIDGKYYEDFEILTTTDPQTQETLADAFISKISVGEYKQLTKG
jgi:hypothetical protein